MYSKITELLKKYCDGEENLSIFVDFSGSRSKTAQKRMIQFIEPALKCFDIVQVYLHTTQIIAFRQFCKDKYEIPYFMSGEFDDHVRFSASGGTMHNCVFNTIEYQRPTVKYSIIVTDGFSNIELIYKNYKIENVNIVLLLEEGGAKLNLENESIKIHYI